MMCLLLLPPALVIMGLASLYILLRDGRPVFFVHHRVGKNGRLFRLPKLRTLRTDVDRYRLLAESQKESYATLTGKFLRRHRIDELPQIFSVLAGQMSLVGPRPELPDIAANYGPLGKKRLCARPGITGLWQIMANREEQMNQNMKYDLCYLRKASLRLDLWILIMTVPFILSPKGKRRL
jgi:lipopolysaccharide/colanic/teichoic acid biosynthesis glycosyltransferase